MCSATEFLSWINKLFSLRLKNADVKHYLLSAADHIIYSAGYQASVNLTTRGSMPHLFSTSLHITVERVDFIGLIHTLILVFLISPQHDVAER